MPWHTSIRHCKYHRKSLYDIRSLPVLRWDERNYFSGGSLDPVSNSQKARHISMCSKSPSHIILNWRRTSPLLFFFLIGAITPVITWAMSRRFPRSFFKYIKCDSFFNPSEFLIFDDEFTSSMWSLFLNFYQRVGLLISKLYTDWWF